MSVTIKDPEGNKPQFAQWECDRLLVISGTEDMPICRFAHPLLTHALVVNGEASGNDWTVKVPNFLLQFEGRFAVSVVVENSNDEVREIAAAVFVILPRQKPQDYEYTDNIGYVNWVLLSQQAQDLIDEIQEKLDNGELKGDPFVYSDFTEEQLAALKGEPGDDGVSPGVSITTITGGHRVSITDADHPSGQSFDVMDGEDGKDGADGQDGAAATVSVGTTTTLSPGSDATVANSGDSSAAVLNFGIPKGAKGDTGATPDFSIGTVTTGAAGSSAAATITGTDEAPVLNLTIPQGLKGDAGNGDMLAPSFSASNAYSAGDYVIYNGSLYCFTADHAAGAWTGTDASAAKIANDVRDVKSALTYTETVTDFTLGQYINNKGDVGTVVTLSYVDSASYNCVLLEVKKGESFTITGLGGNAARLWCLTDTDKKVVAISDANLNASGVTVAVPADGFLACDFYTSVTPSLTINRLITADEVKAVEEKVDELNDNVLENLGGEKVVNLPLVTGYVDCNNGNLSNYDDNNKYKRTDKMSIPDGTDEIIINSAFNASAGWAVYDSNQVFITGGTSKIITAQNNYKYIAVSSFDSTGVHADKTVTYVYKSALQTVISCWGDSITEGMYLDGNHSAEYGKAPYPAQLNTIMTDNGHKDFTVNNYGHGGECMPDVVSRLGAVCAIFGEDVIVPGDGTSVVIGTHAESGGLRTDSKIQIPFKNKNDVNYNVALTQLSHDTNPVTINGDQFSMSISSQTIYLSQTTGTAITIPKGSLMFTADNRNSTIDIVYAGVNDAVSLTLEIYLKFMAKVAAKNPKYLCIGCQNALFQYWSDLTGTIAEKYAAYSAACTEQMGVHFVDLYQEFYPVALKYALEGGYFSGKTAEELAAMEALLAQKIMPAEFSYDDAHQGNVHLNAAGYYVMARIIYNRLVALNYI